MRHLKGEEVPDGGWMAKTQKATTSDLNPSHAEAYSSTEASPRIGLLLRDVLVSRFCLET
jgi:hypothetical protein